MVDGSVDGFLATMELRYFFQILNCVSHLSFFQFLNSPLLLSKVHDTHFLFSPAFQITGLATQPRPLALFCTRLTSPRSEQDSHGNKAHISTLGLSTLLTLNYKTAQLQHTYHQLSQILAYRVLLQKSESLVGHPTSSRVACSLCCRNSFTYLLFILQITGHNTLSRLSSPSPGSRFPLYQIPS